MWMSDFLLTSDWDRVIKCFCVCLMCIRLVWFERWILACLPLLWKGLELVNVDGERFEWISFCSQIDDSTSGWFGGQVVSTDEWIYWWMQTKKIAGECMLEFRCSESPMNVRLNNEPLGKVNCFSTLYRKWQQMEDLNGTWYIDGMRNVRRWGVLKCVLINSWSCLNAKMYEWLILWTVLYGAETWDMRSAERKKVNVLQKKCLRSVIGVTRMDRVRKDEVWETALVYM